MEENQTAPITQAYVGTQATQPISGKTAKEIRLLNLILLLVCIFTIPFVAHVLWAVMMKQYRSGLIRRFILVTLSFLVGGFLILGGLLGNLDTTGKPFYGFLIPGLLIYLAPFLYTFYKPGASQT